MLTLGGANLFTGGVTINAGTLTAGSATALGPAANATLTFGSGSTGKFQLNGKMQGLEQRNVFGHIVVLVPDPLCDSDHLAIRLPDDHADSRWPRAAMGSTVNVRYQMRHSASSEDTMRQAGCQVKSFVWYLWECPFGWAPVESVVDNSAALDQRQQTTDCISVSSYKSLPKKSCIAQMFGIDIHES